jgi:hypothetical protein
VTWEEAIIGVMRKRPSHSWTLTEIYVEIVKLPLVTPHHHEYWGTQPNYHHWVRSALARLRRNRTVKRIARSTYTLVRT